MSEVWEKVRSLYKDYGDTVSLLVLDAEMKFRVFPTNILNEIRAFTTHVSRLANYEFESEEANQQYDRAERHIVRIKLDLHKMLCLWHYVEYKEKFPKKYRSVPLETIVINDIQFQVHYSKLSGEAEKLTIRAKEIEIKGPAEDALPTYVKALSKFRELETFIYNNQQHIDECKRRNSGRKWIERLIIFALGLLSRTIALHSDSIWKWFIGLFTRQP